MRKASPFTLLSSQMLSAKHVPAPSTLAQEERLSIFPSGKNNLKKDLKILSLGVLAQSQGDNLLADKPQSITQFSVNLLVMPEVMRPLRKASNM